MHTHTLAGMTVAAQTGGLLPLNQISIEFHDEVGLHEYEGIAADDNLTERERIVRDLGMKHCLIMRNHGLLTVGRTVAEAFYWMYYLEQACRIQISAQSTGAPLSMPSEDVVAQDLQSVHLRGEQGLAAVAGSPAQARPRAAGVSRLRLRP